MAEAYFERALSVACHQQAKSWELRAAMSMARLWRHQGKRDEARELLAAKSMTPSGKIAAKSPRCRIASRSTPHGQNVPEFQ
jgi:hypothetical protein